MQVNVNKHKSIESLPAINCSKEQLAKEFTEAMLELNEVTAIELINNGANPNQLIPLTKELVCQYLRKMVLASDSTDEKHNHEVMLIEEINKNEELFLAIRDFYFAEQTEVPALILAFQFKLEDLAIALIEKEASLESWLDKIYEGMPREGSDSLIEIALNAGCNKVHDFLERRANEATYIA